MNPSIIFLISLVTDQGDDRILTNVALQVADRNALSEDVVDYPMDDESRNTLHALLPDHVTDGATIVAVSITAIDLIVTADD